jgi:hypothetical protein
MVIELTVGCLHEEMGNSICGGDVREVIALEFEILFDTHYGYTG